MAESIAQLSLTINRATNEMEWKGSISTVSSGSNQPELDFGLFVDIDYSQFDPGLVSENIGETDPILETTISYVIFDVSLDNTAINGIRFSGALASGDYEYGIVESELGAISFPRPAPDIIPILGSLSLGSYELFPESEFWDTGINITVIPESKQTALYFGVLGMLAIGINKWRMPTSRE